MLSIEEFCSMVQAIIEKGRRCEINYLGASKKKRKKENPSIVDENMKGAKRFVRNRDILSARSVFLLHQNARISSLEFHGNDKVSFVNSHAELFV